MLEARVKRALAVAAAVSAAAVVALLLVGRSAPPGHPAERAGPGPDGAGPRSGGAGAAPAPLAAPPPAGSIPGEEGELTAQLRQLVDADPRRAVDLAREAQRRFPEGELADERSWLEMRALVHLGEIAPARDEAMAFFQRFPGSPYAGKVSRLTGVHPRPTPPAP